MGRKSRDVIQQPVRRSIQGLVVGEGFQPECFVFDDEGVHLDFLMVGEWMVNPHSYFWCSESLWLWQSTAF